MKYLIFIKNRIYSFLGYIYCVINPFSINVLSIEETIELAKKKSIIRFGDGEIALLNGNNIIYQEFSIELKNELNSIFRNKDDSLLVCIPDIFNGMKLLSNKDKLFNYTLIFYYRKFLKSIDNSKIYGNTFFSRPYMMFKNKNNAIDDFEKIRALWDNQSILLVEGEFSKSGVGNNLFSNSKSIERIICPAKNSYSVISEIVEKITQVNKDKLVLLALGPTAKVIISRIHSKGYHCIDIGHLDSEYEWLLSRAIEKQKIHGKHTAEFDDDFAEEIQYDSDYINQIIYQITESEE